MYKNNEQVIAAYNSGESLNGIFFWGHTKPACGSVTKSCLSQWYTSDFQINGIHYLTAEHYMMAEKARCFQDVEMELKILSTKHPKEAKDFGRNVENFDAKVWDKASYTAVVDANYAKFCQNIELNNFLLETGERILVEASPVDRIWGVGMAQDHPKIENPNFWKGRNMLGYALMKVRGLLLKEG